MVLAEIPIKLIFSQKEIKGKQCAAFGCSNTFYGPNGLPIYELSLLQVYARRHVILLVKYLSFYTYLILFEL